MSTPQQRTVAALGSVCTDLACLTSAIAPTLLKQLAAVEHYAGK